MKRTIQSLILSCIFLFSCGTKTESSILETQIPASETPEPTQSTNQVPMKTVNALNILLTIPESWTTKEDGDTCYFVPDMENSSVFANIAVFANNPSDGVETTYSMIEENYQGYEFTYEPFFGGRRYIVKTDQGTIEQMIFSVNNGNHIIVSNAQNMSMKNYLINADYSNITLTLATPVPTPEPTPEPQSGISMQSFLALQCDMTLAEVQAVLNSEGKCTSSYDVMGATSETWEFGSSILNGITCAFTDGKLSSKTQAGLTEGVPAPTKEQYNQCIEGMSYAEVAAILGEGELSSVIWIFGVEEATYEWGTILKSATISFSSGRLSTKYSYGLE